jgi:hypothetical protein
VRILTVGDCLMSEVQSFLHPLGHGLGLEMDFRYFYFSASQGPDVVRDGIATTLAAGGVDVVAASYLSYEGIPLYRALLLSADRAGRVERGLLIDGIIRFMGAHLRQIRELTDAPILLHNASGLPLSRWRRRIPFLPASSSGRRRALDELNSAVALLVESVENCILIDRCCLAASPVMRRSTPPGSAVISPRSTPTSSTGSPASARRSCCCWTSTTRCGTVSWPTGRSCIMSSARHCSSV